MRKLGAPQTYFILEPHFQVMVSANSVQELLPIITCSPFIPQVGFLNHWVNYPDATTTSYNISNDAEPMLSKGNFPRMAKHWNVPDTGRLKAWYFSLVNSVDRCTYHHPACPAKVKAMLHGRVLVIDEFDKAPTEVVLTLKGLLQLDETMTLAAPTERQMSRVVFGVWNIPLKYLLETIS